jgi:alpha-N-arabinofuranosidase
MVTDYIGGPEANRIELDCTETNSGSMSSKEGTSLTNGLFLADTIATAMSTELKSLIWWDFRNSETSTDDDPALYGWRPYGDDGMVSIGNRKDCPLNTLFPPYYAEKLLTKWARGGDALVTATSDVPQMSVYAARHSSGELTLLVINKQNSVDMTATIKILGFTPSSHQARAYRYGEPEDRNQRDVTPFTVDGVASNFTATFPAYSMSVICVK